MNIIKIPWQRNCMEELAFKLLLGPQVIAVSTLLLATVDRTRVKTGITPGKSVTKIFSEVANILLLINFLPFTWKTTKGPVYCQTQKTEWTLEKVHKCGTAHVHDYQRSAQVSNNNGPITLAPYRLQYSSQILKHLCDFPLPLCWFGYYSRLTAPKCAWLNIGEEEGQI